MTQVILLLILSTEKFDAEKIVLHTDLNLPSLIFTLDKPEIDSVSLEFASCPIFLHNSLHIIQLAQF